MLAYEAEKLRLLARDLGVPIGPESWARDVEEQGIFHESQFTLLLRDFERRGNRLGVAYFHGRPGTPGFPEFDACFDTLRRRHGDVDRVQITNAAMHEVVLETGIDPEKLHRIPIGVDTDVFTPGDAAARAAARASLGIPSSAFVVGSFQKDGVGWGDGLEPKLIKGPDVLLAVAEQLETVVPELWFLLTGPSRGFVKAGLDRHGVPYVHRFLPSTEAIAAAYDALDLCLVTSREEGGPKAVLEAMAKRVPLVTTRVGQGADLVVHARNGFVAEIEDVEALAHWAAHVAHAARADLDPITAAGLDTAHENSYASLRPRWTALLEGLVEIPRGG